MDKQAFFKSAELKKEVFEMTGFGKVGLTALTLAQRLEVGKRNKDDPARTLAWVVCNGVDGLGDEDVDSLLKMDSGTIEDIANRVLTLSGAGADSDEEAKND